VEGGAGTVNSPAVPPGYVWVIRDMVAATQPGGWYLPRGFTLTDSVVFATVWNVGNYEELAGQALRWHGHQVLEEHDYLIWTTYDGPWSLRVSGYVLTLP